MVLVPGIEAYALHPSWSINNPRWLVNTPSTLSIGKEVVLIHTFIALEGKEFCMTPPKRFLTRSLDQFTY